jgi:hypothetical protein
MIIAFKVAESGKELAGPEKAKVAKTGQKAEFFPGICFGQAENL